MNPSIGDMITGVRKYRMGLVLAHQHLEQLKHAGPGIQEAILSNCGTRIVFQCGEYDGRFFAAGFSGFEAEDLQNLEVGEAIVRVGKSDQDFNLAVAPPLQRDKGKVSQVREIQLHSIAQYGGRPFISEFTPREPIHGPTEKEVSNGSGDGQSEALEVESPAPATSREPNDPSQVYDPLRDKKELSRHRYLQTMLKKMAQERGFSASLEESIPKGGRVDLVVKKEDLNYACEISVSTGAEWEAGNIEKCLEAGFSTVVSIAEDPTQRRQIKTKLERVLSKQELRSVKVLSPEEFTQLLTDQSLTSMSKETTYQGYRVKVEYKGIADGEGERVQEKVVDLLLNPLKSKKNP